MTVNDASLGESGSKLSKVAATSLLMGVTRASSEAYERMTQLKGVEERDSEIAKVQDLEQQYRSQTGEERVHLSISAFHDWHAAACVLFDKWFYPTDEDWVKFQDINGEGNGHALKHDYDKIYSSYQKLMARLQDGRGLKSMLAQQNVPRYVKLIAAEWMYHPYHFEMYQS